MLKIMLYQKKAQNNNIMHYAQIMQNNIQIKMRFIRLGIV